MPTQRTRPSTPFLVITVSLLVVALVVAFWAMTPRTGRRPGSHDAPCQKCGQYMQGLAVGVRLWAEHHDGSLPAPDDVWVNLLVTDGYAPMEMFTSPEDPRRERISYFYVPAQAIDPTGEQVLLYESLDLHPECGVHIAYHDGHVRLHNNDEAARIIAALTLPDGTPWHPHIKPDSPPPVSESALNPQDIARDLGVVVTNRLPRRLKFAKHKIANRLTLGDNLDIMHAETRWSGDEVPWPRFHGSALWVERFSVEPHMAMVQIGVGRNQPWGLLNEAAARAETTQPLVLVDTRGRQHPAIGWVYTDRDTLDIRYQPDEPGITLSTIAESGIQLRNSRVDQSFHLLFLCDADARIEAFQTGDEVLGRLELALPVTDPHR